MMAALKDPRIARYIALADTALKADVQREKIVELLANELRVLLNRYQLHCLQAAPLPELDDLFDAIDDRLRKLEENNGPSDAV